jgi:hypothetical protein
VPLIHVPQVVSLPLDELQQATVLLLSHSVGRKERNRSKSRVKSSRPSLLAITLLRPPITAAVVSSIVSRPHIPGTRATLLPALSWSMSCRDRGGLYKKEKADPASENAPSRMPVTPLHMPLNKRSLTYPYTALSRRSDRRPAARGRAPRSEPTGNRSPFLFTHTNKARIQDSHAAHVVSSARPHSLWALSNTYCTRHDHASPARFSARLSLSRYPC